MNDFWSLFPGFLQRFAGLVKFYAKPFGVSSHHHRDYLNHMFKLRQRELDGNRLASAMVFESIIRTESAKTRNRHIATGLQGGCDEFDPVFNDRGGLILLKFQLWSELLVPLYFSYRNLFYCQRVGLTDKLMQ